MKYLKFAIIAIYSLFILTQTVLKRVAYPEPIFYGLFWEYQNGFWKDIYLNILLFLPMGFIIGGQKGIIVSLCFSCGIEAFQYFFCLGFCELDDIMNNTFGSCIGALCNYGLKKYIDWRKRK